MREIIASTTGLADDVGFEPTEHISTFGGLAIPCNRPLCQSSIVRIRYRVPSHSLHRECLPAYLILERLVRI